MPYPYANTVGGLAQVVRQLRSAFPQQVSSDTLKKWGIAPNNESYILNTLKFLHIIGEDGKKNSEGAKVFLENDELAFAAKLGDVIKKAYAELFESFGEKAWDLDRQKLTGFFRAADETSATIGDRQAITFVTLAQLAGHGELPEARRDTPSRRQGKKPPPAKQMTVNSPATEGQPTPLGTGTGSTHDRRQSPRFTIRIEVNLPITDDQTVYDKIFNSIRTNLIDVAGS